MSIQPDADLHNADWTKATWDLPTDLGWYIVRYGEDLADWFVRFRELPAYAAMPEDLKRDIINYLEGAYEEKGIRHVRDAAYWGKPVGTPITPGMKPQSITRQIDARVRLAEPLTVKVQPGWREADLDEFMSVVDNQISDPSLGLRPLQRLFIMQETQTYLEQKWHSGYISDKGTAIVVSDDQADLLLKNGDIETLQRAVTDLEEKVPCPRLTIQIDNELMQQMTEGDEGALAATTTGSTTPLMAMTTRVAGKKDSLRKKYGGEVAEHWWPDELADFPTGQVILTHEWGHAITDTQILTDRYDALYAIGENATVHGRKMWVSQYAMHSPQEFIAESFVVWYLTKGKTKSRGAQAVARIFGWPEIYPKVLEDNA
jgi:hypothetical protein